MAVEEIGIKFTAQDQDLLKSLNRLSDNLEKLNKDFGVAAKGAVKLGDATKSAGADISKSSKSAAQDVDKLGKSIDKTLNEVKSSSSLKGVLDNIGPAFAAAFALDTIKNAIRSVVDITAQFQRLESVLTNTLGSNSRAQKSLEMIRKFAAVTPFSVVELTDNFVKLANRGFEPNRKQLRALGDLASSTGKDFSLLTEAVLDAQTFEFIRLKEFGISAKVHGDKISFSFKNVTTVVNKTSKSVTDYLLSLGNLEGVSGSMAAISKTLGGQISNLGDSFDAFKNSIGQSLSPIFSALIEKMGKFLNLMTNGVKVVGFFVQKILSNNIAFNAFKALIVPIVALITLYSIQIGRLVAQKIRLAAATGGAMLAQRAFNLVVRANPIGLFITALTSLTAIFFTFKQNIYDTLPALEAFAGKAEEMFERVKIAAKDLFEIDTVEDKAAITTRKELEELEKVINRIKAGSTGNLSVTNPKDIQAVNAELAKFNLSLLKVAKDGTIVNNDLMESFEDLKLSIISASQIKQIGKSFEEFKKGFDKQFGELQIDLGLKGGNKELEKKLKDDIDRFVNSINKGAEIRKIKIESEMPRFDDVKGPDATPANKKAFADLEARLAKLKEETKDLTPQKALDQLRQTAEEVRNVVGFSARAWEKFNKTTPLQGLVDLFSSETESAEDFAAKLINLTSITGGAAEKAQSSSQKSTQAVKKEIKVIELKTNAILADTEAIKANIEAQKKQQDVIAKQIELLDRTTGKLLTIDLELNTEAQSNIDRAQEDINKATLKLVEDRDKELLNLEEQHQEALMDAKRDGGIDLVKLDADYKKLRLKIETEYQVGVKQINDAGRQSLLESERANQSTRLLELKKLAKEELSLLRTVQAETQVIANEQVRSFIDKLVTDFEGAADKLGLGLNALLGAKRLKAQIDFDFSSDELEKERQEADQIIGRAKKDLDALAQQIADTSAELANAELGGESALAERLSVRLKGLQTSFTEAVNATDSIIEANEERIKQADLKLVDATRKKFDAIIDIERKSTEERIKIQQEFILAQEKQITILAEGLNKILEAYKKFSDNPNLKKSISDAFDFDIVISGLQKFTSQFSVNIGKFNSFSKSAAAQNLKNEQEATRLKIQNLDNEIEKRKEANLAFIDLEAQKSVLQQESSDLSDELADKQKEATKELISAILGMVQGLSDTVFGAINEALQSGIDALNASIDVQKEKISDIESALLSGGEAAKKYSVTVLEAEQERLEKLQKLREADVEKQRALAIVQLVINSLIAISQAAAQGGVLAPITIALTLAALAAGLVAARSQAEGAIAEHGGIVGQGTLTNKGGILKGKSHKQGGVLIEAEGGEAIIPKNFVKKNPELIKSILNGEKVKMFNESMNFADIFDSKMRNNDYAQEGKIAQMYARSINDSNQRVIDSVNHLTIAVKNSKSASVTIDENGISAIAANHILKGKKIQKLIKRG